MLRHGLFLLIICFIAVPLAAGEAEPQRSPDRSVGDESIEEIVVTASRRPQAASETPANISVLSASDLAKLPVHDLAEALSIIPGVQVQPRGSFGQPTYPTLQGSHPRHTRIMVDGVLLNTQGDEFANANPGLIGVGNIERVEIIKGASSAVWGSALGGVVNIITKSPTETGSLVPKGSITLSGGTGDIGFWQQSMELSGRAGRLGYIFSNNHLDTDSEFRTNSAFLNDNLFTKLTYEINQTANIVASYNYTSQSIGGYEFAGFQFGQDFRYFSRYGTLGLTMKPDDHLDINATLKSADQDYTLTQFTVPTTTLKTVVPTKNLFSGLDIVSALRISERESVTAGLDIGQDKLNSGIMSGSAEFNRYAVYANYHIKVGAALGLTAGGRYDDNSAYGAQFSPFGGVVYSLPAQTLLKASVSRAFNAPPLVFRYSDQFGFIPNPDLSAERGIVYETSAEAKPLPRLWAKAGLYRAEVTDFVNIVEIVPWTTYQAQNVGNVRRQGVDTEIKYAVTDQLSARASFEYNRVQDRVTGQLIKDNGVARTAYHLGLDYSYGKSLQVGLLGNYYFWNEPPASQPLDRRFIWDARASYEIPAESTSVFVNLYNLFNRPYYYNVLLPSPGRRIELGLKYQF